MEWWTILSGMTRGWRGRSRRAGSAVGQGTARSTRPIRPGRSRQASSTWPAVPPATCSICSPTRAASGCTSATRLVTSRPTCSPGTSGCAGGMCCMPTATTRSVCRRSSTRSIQGQHPRVTTETNIAVMRAQLRRLGLGHDARREFATSDPLYYRWTQWIFGRIFDSWFDERTGQARPVAELIAEFESGLRVTPDGKGWRDLSPAQQRGIVDSRRLAYLSDEPMNWCPALGTVLANEEVTGDGRSDVGNHPVYRRRMRQWMLRITAFASRLSDDLDLVDWPDSVKRMQRHWIGAGQGGDAARSPRMRDWLFSRQRYWGEPFPIVYDSAGLPVLLPDEMLPVELPETTDFRPVPAADEASEPVPPLGRVPGWASVELDLGNGRQIYRRELYPMPQRTGSCRA